MAAKLLHTLADDNADLQKQIGCMTGIFQIFDRHHVLTGRRTAHKRLNLGGTHVKSINFERDSIDAFHQQRASDSNLNQSVKERQRVSMESSRLSFSSSCSSSLSSSEFNKEAPPETSAFDRIIFPESPSSNPMMDESSGFAHPGLQSLDLRDVVRDSMYRETRGLSVKAPTTREEVRRRGRREDTPRPYSLKQNTPIDLSESYRVLAKLREAPQQYNGVGTKDAPRYSSVDSRETFKSTQKLKELPRLSLDSRERLMRNSGMELKTGQLSKSLSRGSSGNNKLSGLQPLSSKGTQKRPPSVVAKLMGLETLPGSPLARDGHQLGLNKTNGFEDNGDPFLRSLREKNLNRPIRFSPSSPRSSAKDPTSPRWKNVDIVMKPLLNSKFPIEPAPWKQPDRSQVQQKQASRPVKALPRVTSSPPSVYSEMEKRLKDLEFKHSGKELRALKQILEAIQSKGFLDTQKETPSLNLGNDRDTGMPKFTISSQNSRGMQSHVTPSYSRGSSSSSSMGVFESPIVIMKPAKLVEKAGIPASSLIPIQSLSGLSKVPREGPLDYTRASTSKRTAKDTSPGNQRSDSGISSVDKNTGRRNVRSSSAKLLQVSKESTSKSLGSLSPRLLQKKLEFGKRSRPPTPPSDSSKSRRQANRQPLESTSPGGKRRPKAHTNFQQNDDHLSQASNESRTSSQSEMEVTSIERAIGTEGGKSPSAIEAAKSVVSNLLQNKSSPRFTEDGTSTNLSSVAPEHPSPISVLDASIYRETACSPVKTKNVIGNGAHDSIDEHTEDQWNPAYSFSETTSGFSPEMNRKKLQNVEHLVQKLRRLNSSHDEASQDYIASLCENTDPNTDHRYISEILLASGLLLRDLGSGLTTFQLHPSGHPINPELFLVLEQTKASNNHHLLHKEESEAMNNEKLHRRLVFDAVNEILVEKLASAETTAEFTPPWVKSAKMTKRKLSAQQLLKELCSEIEILQRQANCKRSNNFRLEEEEDGLKGVLSEDLVIRSGNWTDFNGEIPGLVLDVERLVFKDLVDEIVRGEAAGLQAKPGRRRMLFADH